MKYPKVGVILVNYNGEIDTAECLASLNQSVYPNSEIIVVDNASKDDSLANLSPVFPDAKFIQSQENLGFTGGNNLGLKYALDSGCDYFLLLNNDTIIDAQAISEFVSFFQANSEIGAAQGKIYLYDLPDKFWNLGAHIRFNGAWMWPIARSVEDVGQYDSEQQIDCASGCMLFIARPVLEKIGLLDDQFFFQAEDVDFCLRTAYAGFKVFYISSAKVWHKVGSSGSNLIHGYFTARNRTLLIRKHSRGFRWPLYLAIHILWSIAIQLNLLIRKRKFSIVRAYSLGLIDGIMNRSGKGRLDALMSQERAT